MPLGDTAAIDTTAKTLTMVLDTGSIVNNRPVYARVRFPVKPSASLQELYDAAYTLEKYTQYDLIAIEARTNDLIGPTE